MDNSRQLIPMGWGRAWTCPALVSAKAVNRQVAGTSKRGWSCPFKGLVELQPWQRLEDLLAEASLSPSHPAHLDLSLWAQGKWINHPVQSCQGKDLGQCSSRHEAGWQESPSISPGTAREAVGWQRDIPGAVAAGAIPEVAGRCEWFNSSKDTSLPGRRELGELQQNWDGEW